MPIPTDHAKPIRVTAKENAFNQLQQWIIDGTLHAGEKLNDTELAEALGVSRTPIRESLQLLEVQGFVKMFPGKATQVTEVDRNSITELLPHLLLSKHYQRSSQSHILPTRPLHCLKVRMTDSRKPYIQKIIFLR